MRNAQPITNENMSDVTSGNNKISYQKEICTRKDTRRKERKERQREGRKNTMKEQKKERS